MIRSLAQKLKVNKNDFSFFCRKYSQIENYFAQPFELSLSKTKLFIYLKKKAFYLLVHMCTLHLN